MEKTENIEKKTRCPKGFVRNKDGFCVPKVVKPKENVVNVSNKSKKFDKIKKVSPKAKTMKKMTKIQAAKLLAERRECIQKFRNNLTIIH